MSVHLNILGLVCTNPYYTSAEYLQKGHKHFSKLYGFSFKTWLTDLDQELK